MREGGARDPHAQLLRVLEGLHGRVDFDVEVCPRFDYGEVRPWVRQHGGHLYSATGGNDALVFSGDPNLVPRGNHDLAARITLHGGDRVRLSIQYVSPELLDDSPPKPSAPRELDRRLKETVGWWRRWSSRVTLEGPDRAPATRSAIVLKALSNAPTGAIVAAPTTSLPETPGGVRNWDYRYSWVRDSVFAARSLAELGRETEAEGFRRFIERSAAGSAQDLLVLYGVGGERRHPEVELTGLEGYRRARPVRVGNSASRQTQLDMYGHILELAWRWHQRGHSPSDDYWPFLVELVDAAADRWMEPDRGIWEVRGRSQHFVHSKVMCWAAVDRGIRLAKESGRPAPVRRWTAARARIRRAVETRGFDSRRGVFVRAFGRRAMDASLLLLPSVGFVDYRDERMLRTVEASRKELDRDGLLVRYRAPDGLPGQEGAFLACSFWLAECLARQGRCDEARAVFDRAASTANDVGLFAEEFDTGSNAMLGNFPQGLTHLSHIAAAVALAGVAP
jgi:GH15 family glucan-1,4-alpha-glucosidase